MFFTKQLSANRMTSAALVTRLKAISALTLICAAFPVCATFPETDLRSYSRDFPVSKGAKSKPTSNRASAELIPRMDITGGGLGITRAIVDVTGYRTVPVARPYTLNDLWYYTFEDGEAVAGPYNDGVCKNFFSFTSSPLAGSSQTFAMKRWINDGSFGSDPPVYRSVIYGCGDTFAVGPPANEERFTTDEVTFGAPVRRTAIDGSQYDASPWKLTRNGLPCHTQFFGYHLGLVANESNWDAANLGKAGDLAGFFRFPSTANNFELTVLPPPWVEDDVVEYVNRQDFPKQPGGQFFYAVRAEDKTLLDSFPAWQRAGKAFKSGGYVSACRFYGGKNGGPNTHFYSADDKE